MNHTRKRNAWIVAAALALAVSDAVASSDTPSWEEAQAASPHTLTEQERIDLERRAASGESALKSPEGIYVPEPGSPDKGDERRAAPAKPAPPAPPADAGERPAMPPVPADAAESRDDAGARNDVAPRKRDIPVDRKRG